MKKSNLRNKNLAFFFTTGMSLKKWSEGGMLRREIELYNLLAKYFNKIYFFTYGGRFELKYKKYLAKNIEIIYKNKKTNNLLYSVLIPFYHRIIIKNCSFLKSNQMFGAWTAVLAKKISKKSKFILRTGYTWSLFQKEEKTFLFSRYIISIIEKFLYKRCDKAFVTSEKDEKYILKKYKIKNQKVKIIPNYINTKIFKPKPKIKKKAGNIIFVGRLNKQKNLFSLIRALQDTDINLDIIGEGNLKNNLETFAQKNKVVVNFLGIIPNFELPECLNKYKLFVLPSYNEGMPKTLLEAMSCGLACIATNVDGSKEVITNNKTGLLADTSSASLRKNILRLIGDKKLQETLGENSRKFILENHSISKQIEKEVEVYEKLC